MRKLLAFFLAWGIAQAVHAEVRNPHGVAVIVGNGDYEHQDVPDVAYALRDAAAFARYVTDVLGFDPKNVTRVTDATRRKMFDLFGTKSDPRGDLWSSLDPDGGSEVVVFYSGHGVPGQRDGRGYLLPVDADPEAAEDDGYPVDLLYGNLGRLEEASSVRVYLDACFSGGSHGGGLIGSASPVFVKAALPEGLSGKVTALAAASGTQIASWDEEARHGLFTHHLLDALYGKGDADGDGKVTGGEARAYLDRYMTRAARRQHRRVQRASLIGPEGAVLSSAPSEGFPARPAPDGKDDAAFEQALRLDYENRVLVQRGLAALGAAAGPSDGIFGRRTREALRRWQEGRGVEATGYLTRRQADVLIVAGKKTRGNAKREQPPDPVPKTAAAPPKLTPVNKIMVAKRRTALRRYPDLMAGLAGYVESGEKIDVLARTKGWYQVGRELEIAYASADTLRDLRCRMMDRMKKVRRTVDKGRDVYGHAQKTIFRERCLEEATREFRDALSKFAKDCRAIGGALENEPEMHKVLFSKEENQWWRCSINFGYHLEEVGKEPVVPLCVVYDSERTGEDEVCE